MLVINRKYAIRKLVIGVVSLVIGLSATNSSYIHAKEIETIAKFINNEDKILFGENDSLRVSVIFKGGVPHIELRAYKNLKNLIVELADKNGKTYKTNIDSLEKERELQSELKEIEQIISDKDKYDNKKQEKNRKIVSFAKVYNNHKFEVKISYEISSKDNIVENKNVPKHNSTQANTTQLKNTEHANDKLSSSKIVENKTSVKKSTTEISNRKTEMKVPVAKTKVEAPRVKEGTKTSVVKTVKKVPEVRKTPPIPVTQTVSESPKLVTEAPATRIVTEAPVTRVVTEAPATRIVTEAPVTRVVTEAPATRIVTEAPATRIVTEAPVTRVVTEAPATRIVTHQPAPIVVSDEETTRVETPAPIVQVVTETPATRVVVEAPITRIVTEVPVTRLVTEAPATRIVTEAPVTRVVTEAPATKIVTEAPITKVLTEKPVTKVVTEAPTSKIVSKGMSSIQKEKLSIPIVMSKGEEAPVVEEKPSIPVVTSKGEEAPILEEKPRISVPVSEVETTTKQEEKTSTTEVTSKAETTTKKEEKPKVTEVTSKVETTTKQEEKPSTTEVTSKVETTTEVTITETTRKTEEKPNISNTSTQSEEKEHTISIKEEKIEKDTNVSVEEINKTEDKVNNNPIEEKPINKLIKIGAKKEKPILTYASVNVDELTKQLNLSYDLADQHIAYIRSRIAIYDGDKLVKEFDIDDLDQVKEELEHYDTPYRIVTTMTYDMNDGVGPQEAVLEDRIVEMKLKKLEINDFDSADLYKYEDGYANFISTLSEIPTDIEKYFVKITSDKFKDKLLPVSKIEEIEENGIRYFEVTSDVDGLVQNKIVNSVSKYESGFSFLVQKLSKNAEEGVYTSFRDLANAIKSNPEGEYKLGAELFASDIELESSQNSYLGDFSGTLIGSNNGNSYAIYGLKAPLFNELTGSVVDLDLEDVKIKTDDHLVGALARTAAANANISNVAVSGDVRGERTVGGLIGNVNKATIDNISFVGKVHSTSNLESGRSFVGGLAGIMDNGNVSRVYVDAEINTLASNNSQRAAGIIGQVNNGSVSKVYSKGTITSRSTNNKTTSGIVASLYPNATLSEAISEMNVPNGILIYADTNHTTARIDNSTVAAVDGIISYTENAWSSRISKIEAEDRLESYGITATIEDSADNRVVNSRNIDYTNLHNANQERNTAYVNIEKLIPHYNKEQVIKYGNLVDVSNKLFTEKLLSVIPMNNDEILSNVTDKNEVNKLMLHYADGSIEYVNVSYKEDFDNTRISEYSIEDTDLIYTFEKSAVNYSDIVDATLEDLKSVKLKSEEVLNALGVSIDVSELVKTGLSELAAKEQFISDKIDQLYIEEKFEQVKSNIEKHLVDILATDKVISVKSDVINDYLVNYIKDNKEELLLGLSYMQRWYDINFNNFNFQRLATYHQDFFGKPVNTLEWLVSLAKEGYENIKPSNNVITYRNSISPNTGIDNQMDYLSRLRQLFLPNKTDAEWYKDNTKAYIVEQKSEENPDIDVSFWQRVKDSKGIPVDELNGVLPLLTAKEGIFVITNMSSITYGMYERYIDMNLKKSNLEEYNKKLNELKEKIDTTAKRFAENIDVWYRIVDDSVKANMIKVIPIWDGYKRYDKKWLPMYGVNNKYGTVANDAIKDFFGPIGDRAAVPESGSGALANGWNIKYVHYAAITDTGLGTYSHEMTHNLDGIAYLGNYERRDGMRGESYATGMFEAPVYNSDVLAYNLIYDNVGEVYAKDRYQVVDPKRFKDSSDLQEYTKGTLDVLYTLDYAETTAILEKPEEEHKKWFIKIENSTNAKGELIGRYRTITNEEWDKMQLSDINDLIDNDIMTKRSYKDPDNKELTRNGYDTVHMFSPIYSALSNDDGTPSNSLMFKLRSYELMAAKGYEEGFLPYASNMLNGEAKEVGLATQTEKFVLNKIFNGKYNTWADFKKEAYKERINKVTELKPVVINYNDSEITISNFNQIQKLMNVAVNQDLTANTMNDPSRSRVYALKAAIYNGYLRSTNDFENSIYTN